MLGDYRFQPGDVIRASVRASVTTENILYVRVQYDDGTWDTIRLPCTHSAGNRSNEIFSTPKPFTKPGRIDLATVENPDSPVVRRGQIYMMAQIGLQGTKPHAQFLTGYSTTPNHLGVGQFEDSFSGRGYRRVVAIADDVTPVDITSALAIANAIRKIYGFVWYYNCAAEVATRTTIATLRNVLGAGPTGFAGDVNAAVWQSPSPSLTTGQEGTVYCMNMGDDGPGRSMSIDDGVPTVLNMATNPLPFPYVVLEDDPGELFFDVANAHADDRHSIYLFVEEWIIE